MPVDVHATGEGYLRSPRHGSLRDVVTSTITAEREAGVVVARRLGVSLDWWLFAGEYDEQSHSVGESARPGSTEWGGEWIETKPRGPQGWWPASRCDGDVFDGLARLGLRWVCLGASVGDHLHRIAGLARDRGLGLALRPSHSAVRFAAAHPSAEATWESLPTLLKVLVAGDRADDPPESMAEVLRAVGRASLSDVARAVDRVSALGIPVVPLLTAAERQAGLRALVWSPQLSAAAIALPYHDRLLSLRAPGALRMGGREAALHLGIPVLDRAGEREAAAGLERCREAIHELYARGHDLRAGSGAPGAGCAPGAAALDESAALAALRAASERVSR
ncbi:hypothetical protein [Microbacterium sp. LMI1-1-1.1]|uniref:hypothetical protein n=1 Tax=Microbacterium sp. LMI1-1-1.1 TaxID=3135223 RepID=UPI003465E043